MSVERLTHCRICRGSLELVLDLGEQYIATYFEKPGEEVPYRERIPLELCECTACHVWQLSVTVDPELLYRRYWYRSGVNQTMREALGEVVQTVMAAVELKPGDWVIDIGSNDWTLLRQYPTGIRKRGYEPSQVAEAAERPLNSILEPDFFHGSPVLAKAITAIAMFYDLHDPEQFLEDVWESLEEDGVFVVQLSYLPLMLRQTAFDNICHEHLFYYSLSDLINLFSGCGLHIYQASLNDVNGGSIRVTASKVERPVESSVREILDQYEGDLVEQKRRFPSQVRERVQKVRIYLEARHVEGKTISLVGASTKGNVFLQYAGFDHSLISFAAERNPEKWGATTLGTGIPIKGEREESAVKLVMPWHFLPEICERERWAKQELVVALPDFLTLRAEDCRAKLEVFRESLGVVSARCHA